MNKGKTGIVLVNLGTPDSYKTKDVRRYLTEFLTDGRVIDIPYIQRNLLVRGIIGPSRSPKSAALYKEIWTDEGSPLLVISEQLRTLVAAELGSGFEVKLAMRYQKPSIASALEGFKGMKLQKLTIIPLFPQYASASTGSVHQEVMRIVSQWQVIPEIEFLNSYPVDAGMLDAIVDRASAHDLDEMDHVLFSFHGLPERQLIKANAPHNFCLQKPGCCDTWHERNHYCYSAQCHATARALVDRLGLPPDKWTLTFQSRLGKTPWIKPFTIDALEKLASNGVKKVLCFCPAFTADCLETLYEISHEYNREFQNWGGESLTLVESLNTHPKWVKSIAKMCRK